MSTYFTIFYSFGLPFFQLWLINGESLQPANGWSDWSLGTSCASYMPIHCFQLSVSIGVQLRSWVQKVLHIPIKIKVVVFYFKLYKYIV